MDSGSLGWDFASGIGCWPARPVGVAAVTKLPTFRHKPAKCDGCGVYYKTLAALSKHVCYDVPGYLALEALKALAPFDITSDLQARTLLSMWARRKEMTEAEYDYARREAVK
jgi:hypothetical protein